MANDLRPGQQDTASTETPASGLADKTPALSSDAEDMKPLTKVRLLDEFARGAVYCRI